MGFYNLLGSELDSVKDSMPGSEAVISTNYITFFSTSKTFYFSTSISFSTGTYGIYISNFSPNNIKVNVAHPTEGVFNNEIIISPNSYSLKYIDGAAQNISISILQNLIYSTTSPQILNFATNAIGIAGVYDGTYFVLGGAKSFSGIGAQGDGAIAKSRDGINWEDAGYTSTDRPIYSMAYTTNMYVTGGGFGLIRYSTSLQTWGVGLNFGTNSDIKDIKYVNGIFLSSSPLSTVAFSTNGVNWTTRSTGLTGPIVSVNYLNGQYMALTNAGTITTSTNQTTWTTRLISGITAGKIFVLNNMAYLYRSSPATIYMSTDAITWTTTRNSLASFGNPREIIYLSDQQMFVATTDSLSGDAISTDAINWSLLDVKSSRSATLIYSSTKVLRSRNGVVNILDLRDYKYYLEISKIKEAQ